MKNLHFYFQFAMLIIALGIAVQVPFIKYLIAFVCLIELILFTYQLIMSCMLMAKLSYQPLFLKIHFFGCWSYILILILLSLTSPSWMNSDQWKIALMVIPWFIAIFFLITLNDLERTRNYQI